MVVTEKIDGTSAQVVLYEHPIEQDPCDLKTWKDETGRCTTVFPGNFAHIRAGSRTRWITPADDNFGFARWAQEHAETLWKLGPGRHYGEGWGSGIQRGYGLTHGDKRCSLFSAHKWNAENVPEVLSGVPTL